MEIFVRIDGRYEFAEGAVSLLPTWVDDAAVFLDGRIDNLADLCGALRISETAGVHAALIQGFRRWQAELAARLVGEFAFVIVDRRHRQVIAARDHFGVRPLFYTATDRGVSVSSRVSLLVRSNEPIDDHRIVEYLIGRYDAPGRTFFSRVREVPPGCAVLASPHSLIVTPYTDPEVDESRAFKTANEFEARFRQLFLQAVARRLDPGHPVVIHVSGGLDSSAIACAADVVRRSSKTINYQLVGAAAVYPGLACDESKYIDDVAKHVGYPITRWDDTSAESRDLFDPHPDEPGLQALFRGGSAGDLELAKTSNAMVLVSGLGGDNLGMVEGYIADLFQSRRWIAGLRELVWFPGATVRTRLRRIRRTIRQAIPDSLDGYLRGKRTNAPPWLTPYGREIARSIGRGRQAPAPYRSHLQRSLWRRLKAPETLRNIGMMNICAASRGCEYRFPFLDMDLIRCALSAPLESWPHPVPFGRLHRAPLAELLPRSVATRFGKAEFTPAVALKVRAAGRAALDTFGNHWAAERYLDTDATRHYCRTMIEWPGSPPPGAWAAAWAILTLEAWLRRREGLLSIRLQQRS